MTKFELEFVQLLESRIQDIRDLIEEGNLPNLIESFNEFVITNDMNENVIYLNDNQTWEMFKKTNTQEEIQEAVQTETFDKIGREHV